MANPRSKEVLDEAKKPTYSITKRIRTGAYKTVDRAIKKNWKKRKVKVYEQQTTHLPKHNFIPSETN